MGIGNWELGIGNCPPPLIGATVDAEKLEIVNWKLLNVRTFSIVWKSENKSTYQQINSSLKFAKIKMNSYGFLVFGGTFFLPFSRLASFRDLCSIHSI